MSDRLAISEHGSPYDLAVIGSGPAGLSAALVASRTDASTVIIDAPAPERPVEVVPAITQSIVRTLGVDPDSLFHDCPRVNSYVSTWNDGVARRRSTMTGPFGEDFVVDRSTVRKRFLSIVVAAGAEPRTGRVTRISRTENHHFLLEMVDGTTVLSHRLVIASGRAAFGALGGNPMIADDRRVAIFPAGSDGDVQPARSAELLLESCPYGWWYGVRIEDQGTLPVLVTSADTLPTRGCLPEWFKARLRSTALLSRCTDTSEYRTIPLRVCSARTCSRSNPGGDGWALAGDARVAISPLSGNGVLRAMQDGARAARFVLGEPGRGPLKRYLQAHRADVDGTRRQRLG